MNYVEFGWPWPKKYMVHLPLWFVCLCVEWKSESRGSDVQKYNGGVFWSGPVPEQHGHVIGAQDLRPEK